jgi:AcrR family transcriptional regulator
VTTKEKILKISLSQFNNKGTEKVTVRDIAHEMKISHGNLCYHFPKKENIIEALYDQLVAELDKLTTSPALSTLNISILYTSIESSFKLLYAYRFIFIDIIPIMRNMPNLKIKFNRLLKRREQEFKYFFTLLKNLRYFRDDLDEYQYEQLFRQFFIISNSWITDSELFFKGTENKKLIYYSNLLFSFLIPYFTPKALKEYREMLN